MERLGYSRAEENEDSGQAPDSGSLPAGRVKKNHKAGDLQDAARQEQTDERNTSCGLTRLFRIAKVLKNA